MTSIRLGIKKGFFTNGVLEVRISMDWELPVGKRSLETEALVCVTALREDLDLVP